MVEYIKIEDEGDEQKSFTEVAKSWPQKGRLELKDVKMRYAEHLPYVLKGMSLTINAGEKVGVVGRTGAGKSSVILCLFRMVPFEGSILIDGQDISSLHLPVLRRSLGMIPQDSFLFSGTIRSNLDVFDEHDDAAIWTALELVDLKNLVAGFKDGLSQMVAEAGSDMSGGQVQLFCLARVLLKNPKVIFMDEATASVDLATDEFVQKTIRERFDSSTIFTIAHRIQTVIDFDRICCLDQGRVAEYDAPAVLLQDPGGILSNLVESTGESSATELRLRANEAFSRAQSEMGASN
jgi:ATP-binding cassette subfamily C (CFTR/MRP) protein 1